MAIELMAEAERLREHYTFVIRPHPHLYTGTYTRDWKAFLKHQEARGFLISPPDEDLGEVLASASAIVCDDLSSVILYAAALNKRIILVPSGVSKYPLTRSQPGWLKSFQTSRNRNNFATPSLRCSTSHLLALFASWPASSIRVPVKPPN